MPAAPTSVADSGAKLTVDGKPTERGIYAWIAGGSAALVHVHTRPTDHSPGNVLNGSLIHNCTFYDGCAIDQWSGGTWYGPLKHPAVAAAKPVRVDAGGMTFDEWADTYADAIPAEARRAAWGAARASMPGREAVIEECLAAGREEHRSLQDDGYDAQAIGAQLVITRIRALANPPTESTRLESRSESLS
jgi:hypothetical protein